VAVADKNRHLYAAWQLFRHVNVFVLTQRMQRWEGRHCSFIRRDIPGKHPLGCQAEVTSLQPLSIGDPPVARAYTCTAVEFGLSAKKSSKILVQFSDRVPRRIRNRRKSHHTREDAAAVNILRPSGLPGRTGLRDSVDLQAPGQREGMLLHLEQDQGREDRLLLRSAHTRLILALKVASMLTIGS
jgi:hypothetical protein